MFSLKDKAISGIIWSGIERLSVQGIQFVIQIIMARILMPEDFGIVAMISIFIAISQIFVECGFSTALVQKKDRTETDFSTVFYFSIVAGILFYFILFFAAPLIANFYKTLELISLTKIVALNVVIGSFSIVPRAILTARVDFKTQAKVSFVSVFLSGITGIWMAYSGYGVWSLVFQSLFNNGITTLLLWVLSRWIPKLQFSILSFKSLFSFGSKLLFSWLLDTIFRNLYTLVIGRKFSKEDVGYFSRADLYAQLPSGNISSLINRVVFPIMCEIQNDDIKLVEVFEKILRLTMYIVFPLMMGIAALSGPFVRFFLTEKWEPMVLILQILCVPYMFYPVHGLNLVLLQAKGRSDLFLRLEIIKKAIGIIVLVLTIPMGILPMCIGTIISGFISLYINTFYTKRILHIGLSRQLRLIASTFFLSLVMGIIVFLLTRTGLADYLVLVIGILTGIIFYTCLSYLLKFREWNELYSIITNIIKG
jgi:O-antigen/teichoic acid export membrane protein